MKKPTERAKGKSGTGTIKIGTTAGGRTYNTHRSTDANGKPTKATALFDGRGKVAVKFTNANGIKKYGPDATKGTIAKGPTKPLKRQVKK